MSTSPSSAIVERLRRLEGGGLRTFVDPDPLVWQRTQGTWVEDADGRRYLDLYGGYAVSAIGYGHPAVVEAIRRQAGELIHCPSAHPSEARARFLEALASIAPAGLERILPAVTGAMANELAVALARTRRPNGAFVSFTGSYFGRSAGVVGLSGKARYREALALPAAGHFAPFPYPRRMGPDATDRTMDALETLLAPGGGAGESEPAAVILEPVQGNGGVVIPPGDFLPRLRELCDRTGALMIVDEIQSGCGRTGRMWAVEHSGVVPDLVTVGKGIGGGMGVAAVYGRAELMSWRPDTYTSTFLTNAVNLAAASAAIGVLRDDGLPERAARLGPGALESVRDALDGVPGVAEVRGIGLWFGIELEGPDGGPEPAWTARAQRRARELGVIVGRGGYDENVLKLSPALVIDEAELAQGIRTVAKCIEETRERA
jgi:4-aminobutyrate aminotransferase-like enzyme